MSAARYAGIVLAVGDFEVRLYGRKISYVARLAVWFLRPGCFCGAAGPPSLRIRLLWGIGKSLDGLLKGQRA